MKNAFWLAPACFVVVVACGKSTDTVDGDNSQVDARYTFSPRDAERACTTDTDCVLATPLTNCGSCCGASAIARGDGERAYQAVVEACSQSGAPQSGTCLMACGPARAACFENTCVTIAEPFPGSPTADPTACTKPAEPIETTAPAELPARTACGATLVQTGFESGLDPSWTITEPSAVQIDSAAPINGTSSLRISYRQKHAFVGIPQNEACGVRIAFTVRTKILASGVSLGRIVAGDGNWYHLSINDCSFSVAEEIRNSQAAGMGFGGVNWPIPDDTPVRVVLTFDLQGKTMTSTAAPLGQPLPEPKSTALRGDPTGEANPTGIRTIELGSTQGIANAGYGTVWFDDLTID